MLNRVHVYIVIMSILHVKSKLIITRVLEFTVLYIIIGIPVALLISDPAELEGVICHRMVELTCTVQEVSSLRWFFNGDQHGFYFPSPNDAIPPARSLWGAPPGMSIQITRAQLDQQNPDLIYATSVLTTNTTLLARNFAGQTIQCGTYSIRSELKEVNVSILGKVRSYEAFFLQ